MQDIFASLIALFLVEPVQQRIAEALADSRAPQEVVASVKVCVTEHGPQMIDRALGDPWWAVSNALGVWVGSTEPYETLLDAAPGCAGALGAARPFLERDISING